MRCKTVTWLWCLWRVRRIFRRDGLMFSKREQFLRELQPFMSPVSHDRIAWPHAFFWIAPEDVNRAFRAIGQTTSGSEK